MGKFKKGGFLLAMSSGTPIVPVSIDGSRYILPKHKFVLSPGARVRVTFGPPIPVRGRSLDELSAEVRGKIAAHVTGAAE
jgi:1-acyl-sn-glycerol-3-phosphate acyltransferase